MKTESQQLSLSFVPPRRHGNKFENLEKLPEQMCDRYCRFPYICKDEAELMTKCRTCPLNELVELTEADG